MIYRKTLLFLALAAICFGCESSNVTTSADIVGRWTTSATNYEDRNLEVTNDQVIFRVGEQVVILYTIAKIKKIPQKGNWALYMIECEYDENNEKQTQTLSLFFSPNKGGAIKFKNNEGVDWKRKV
ncbi:MAG: hypothetical protein HY200_03160 [Nitrospirae bacterium]|nr:hypothetical protein [Nitrospirota bacterium]MBI3593932.1 hypothetical protein [Nitrospirota bacterium]